MYLRRDDILAALANVATQGDSTIATTQKRPDQYSAGIEGQC